MKKIDKESFIISVIFTILACFGGATYAANKFFKIERSGNCPDTALDAPIYFGNLSASFGKAGLKFIGSIPVKELIKDDIDVRILAQRCDTNGANCVVYTNRTFPNICALISHNPIFGDTFSKITSPPLKCQPMKAKTFTAQDVPVDLSPLNLWPIEGHRWKAMFYFKESGGGKNKRELGCFDAEATVTESRNRGGPRGRG